MFTDPQSVTYAGTTYSLPRVPSRQPNVTVYSNADGTIVLTITQTTTGTSRRRHLANLAVTQTTNDPITGDPVTVSASVQLSFDRPQAIWAFSSTNIVNMNTALQSWATSTAVGKLFGGEA